MNFFKHARRTFLSLAIAAFLPAPFAALRAQRQPSPLRVAAAADLQFALKDIAQQYQHQTGHKVDITFGSSGNFFSQLQNGAPFDVFFSADVEYATRLQQDNLIEPNSLLKYAIGRIVLWMPASSKIDLLAQKWNALLDPSVQKIAIANPEHAPYGRAAVDALKHAGLYDKVESKLVYGENISQAAQFVESGNAQAGIIALSLAVSPAMESGQRWGIPVDQYASLEQAAVILKSSPDKEAAHAFLAFVSSDAGERTLANFGFAIPNAASPAN
ncbi:MAG TPA: molybdate ABC transporter substrate-binding protein [Candidatus Sulfotelmatobacter sp.]|nr:molybdate ABC transporter substrate-binding protein [Candidatus Sulfotelmatobacter sp.]